MVVSLVKNTLIVSKYEPGGAVQPCCVKMGSMLFKVQYKFYPDTLWLRIADTKVSLSFCPFCGEAIQTTISIGETVTRTE